MAIMDGERGATHKREEGAMDGSVGGEEREDGIKERNSGMVNEKEERNSLEGRRSRRGTLK
jgi:hypothetical protein